MADKLTPGQQQALDEARDVKTRAKETAASNTKSTMGEGRLFGSAVEDEQAAQNRREINRLPAKKLVRGGGIESRGKTKGRFV